MKKEYFISADITPDRVLAGDSVEITLRLIAGKDFSAAKSRIILDMPAYLGYTRPSCYDQEDNGYMSVFCSNPDLIYTKRVWDMEVVDFPTRTKTSFKGMAQRLFILDFLQGQAEAGDEVIIKWGYTRDGFGVGNKVCTIVPVKDFYNTIHVRYFVDGIKGLPDMARSFKGYDRPVPDVEIPLSYRIVPREPERIRIIRKHDKMGVLVLDRFSNQCETDGMEEFIRDMPEGSFNKFGVFISEDSLKKIISKKLPLFDTPLMTKAFENYNIYFGDLHTHSAFSNDCIEREKLGFDPYMTLDYARNVALLDFMAVTDHHQPWDEERNKIGKANWEKMNNAVKAHNINEEFVAFPGLEFRCARGDTAVVLNEELDYELIDKAEIKDIRFLWEALKGKDYITIPHFHNPGSLEEGQWYHCPYEGIEPYLEVYSCHGSYENGSVLERHIPEIKSFRPDRNAKYFLQQGCKYGFGCNSDGHKGHPGINGLTAVYAKELTREAIFEAIRNRRIYGTTNARIKLIFTVNGELMGSVLPQCGRKELFIRLEGEQPFKAVDILRNGELYKRFKPYSKEFESLVAVQEDGVSNWYIRATQLDNHIAYSSPVWFE